MLACASDSLSETACTFLPDQVSDYDRKRLEVKEVEQYELFVSDEKSAIQWVRRQLSDKPMK